MKTVSARPPLLLRSPSPFDCVANDRNSAYRLLDIASDGFLVFRTAWAQNSTVMSFVGMFSCRDNTGDATIEPKEKNNEQSRGSTQYGDMGKKFAEVKVLNSS